MSDPKTPAEIEAERHHSLYGMTDAEKAERDYRTARAEVAAETARRIEYERVMEQERAEQAARDAEQAQNAAKAHADAVRAARVAELESFQMERAAGRG
jgi:hypothetical protein